MGVEAGLAIAAGVASAAATTGGAIYTAKQASDRKDDAKNAAAVQQKQLNEQQAVEQARLRAESEKVKGRLRVMAAASGFAVDGGSYGDLIDQTGYDYGLNSAILNQNYRNTSNRLQSGLQAQLADYSAQSTAAYASILPGLIGSLNTGLSINNSLTPRTPAYIPTS